MSAEKCILPDRAAWLDARKNHIVTMGNKNTPYLLFILNDIGKIGNNNVDAEHGFIGKRKTAIHNEHIVSTFVHGHVFADFI